MRQHFIHTGSMVAAPAVLTAILRTWVKHYAELAYEVFEYKTAKREFEVVPDEDWAIERINSGDCGTTALAVWQVYTKLLTPFLRDGERLLALELVDNFNHAYLKLDDVCFDTLNLNGQTDETKMFEYSAPNAKVEVLTSEELFRRYIWKDRIGAELIRRFCQRFYVEPLPEALELLNSPCDLHPTTAAWLTWVDNQMVLTLEPFAPAPDGENTVNLLSSILDEIVPENPSAAPSLMTELLDAQDTPERAAAANAWLKEMGKL